MSHFKLTNETKVFFGVTCYRIQATKNLPKYNITKGDLGGFVEKETNISGDAWVSGNASVYGNAKVFGDAWVESASAILWITLGMFYTATITKKLVFIGCKKFTHKEIQTISKQAAIEKGLPKEYAEEYITMIRAACKIIKK